MTPRAEVVWTAPNSFVVRLQWRPIDSDEDRHQFQVLGIRDDKIREIADYPTLEAATKRAKRFAGYVGN